MEICAIPKLIKIRDGFFDAKIVPHPGFVRTVYKWEKVKGEPTGKYTQRILPQGINLDLFICKPENWGLIFAIRTGSAEFSHKILATGWVKRGFKSVNGMLTKDGRVHSVPNEDYLWYLLDLPKKYFNPTKREL